MISADTSGLRSSAFVTMARTSSGVGGKIFCCLTAGGLAILATFVSHHPHFTAWPRAPDRMACSCLTVAAPFPLSIIAA
jgi:hypothetical protein